MFQNLLRILVIIHRCEIGGKMSDWAISKRFLNAMLCAKEKEQYFKVLSPGFHKLYSSNGFLEEAITW